MLIDWLKKRFCNTLLTFDGDWMVIKCRKHWWERWRYIEYRYKSGRNSLSSLLDNAIPTKQNRQ